MESQSVLPRVYFSPAALAFWKEADDDLPLLVEAKAMRKRLGVAPSSRSPR